MMKSLVLILAAIVLCMGTMAGEIWVPAPPNISIVYTNQSFSNSITINTNFVYVTGASSNTMNGVYSWNGAAYTNGYGSVGYNGASNYWWNGVSAVIFTNPIVGSIGLFATNGSTAGFSGTFSVQYSNVFGITYTNSQITINPKLHTFQLFSTATGTNSVNAIWDRTIDGVNWFPFQTNTWTSSSNFEFYVSGKWAQFRCRLTPQGTNGAVFANYIGE
jgi:hypothetical protein